jgi:glycoprotein endo-alpha-1,2-mannosidase
MRERKLGLYVLLLVVIGACITPSAPTALPTPSVESVTPSATPNPTPEAEPTVPPVVGPDPSYRVATFYYPWYRTPGVDSYWDHWGEGYFHPPLDIASDYYPTLGAYSVGDPAVLAQHFAWLREAGVGVIISSWWGQRSREDQAVALILDVAETYGIKVAFHIEPYPGRTADTLVSDIKYIYRQYGDHPAFCRTTASSRWSPDSRSKGLFFVWAISVPDTESPPIEPSYWQEAMDTIHNLPDGAIVIANATEGYWVDGGHFDGLYNYATLHLKGSDGFSWARGIPPDAWYVPSVLPGFSAIRIRYPAEDNTPRRDGTTYQEQWKAALDVEVEPALITITSFNEWHEGSQIEPAAVGADNGRGYTYLDYGGLPPEGYLSLTNELATQFLAATWPETTRMRVRMVTTSDWTDLNLVSGAQWLRPVIVSVSEEAGDAGMYGGHLALNQPVARAEDGESVEVIIDVLFSGWESEGTVVFEIERGHLGGTQVEVYGYVDDEPVLAESFEWSGIKDSGRNAASFPIPAQTLFGATD